MTAVVLLLLLILGVGLFARSYNKWTQMLVILIIIAVLLVFYLT